MPKIDEDSPVSRWLRNEKIKKSSGGTEDETARLRRRVEESHKEKSGVSEVSETDRLRKRVEELESRERQREREEELGKKVERRLADFQKQHRRQQREQQEEASEKQKKQSAVWAVAIVALPLMLIFGWPLGPILFGYNFWVALAIMAIIAIIGAIIRKLATGSYSAGRYFD